MASLNSLIIRQTSELNEFKSLIILDLINYNILQQLISFNKFYISLSYLEEGLEEVDFELFNKKNDFNEKNEFNKDFKKRKFTNDDNDKYYNPENKSVKIKKLKRLNDSKFYMFSLINFLYIEN